MPFEKRMQSQVACCGCLASADFVDIWIRDEAFKCFWFPAERLPEGTPLHLRFSQIQDQKLYVIL